jgi:uncharacterized protein YjbJ (UPF0337 family)
LSLELNGGPGFDGSCGYSRAPRERDFIMTDEQINGAAAQIEGKAQKGFGKLVGDQKLQVEGAFNDAKGKSLEQFGKAMDAIDRLVEKAPEEYRPKAREVAAAARKKPLVTTLSAAGVGLLLVGLVTRGGRRR